MYKKEKDTLNLLLRNIDSYFSTRNEEDSEHIIDEVLNDIKDHIKYGIEKIRANDTAAVGDRVIVTDNGKSYTTYCRWFDIHKVKTEYACLYDYNKIPDEDKVYEVLAVHPHSSREPETMLYLIRQTEYPYRTYLIGQDGFRTIFREENVR